MATGYYYEVEHFYKNGGPSWTVTMQFPRRQGIKAALLLKWSNNLKLHDPIKISEQWEQQYFYSKKDMGI